MVAKPLFRKQLFRNCKIEVNTAFCTLSYNLNSEPYLYLFGVKKMRFFAIFCTSGLDIQEITLTFRLRRNLGDTSAE